MNVNARQVREVPAAAPPEGQEATVKAAAAWLNQLARTLKTCRLYDANNPTVLKFRDELGQSLRRLLEEQGAITYRFTADDVLLEEASLYPARSRDDNIAFPFHRDGVRALTLSPGIEQREIEALLDAVLQVTGQNLAQDDLVTLLWEAGLRHIEVDFVPADSDFGSGPVEEGQPAVPWPGGGVDEEEPEEATAAGAAAEVEESGVRQPRADDWVTGDVTVETEAEFAELEALAPSEVERFKQEYEAEHEMAAVAATVAIAAAYVNAGAEPEDRVELGRFLPRVLRLAITHGAWLQAREALGILRQCNSQEWSLETFAQELLQPISISSTVERLDQQEAPAVIDFISFAKELGEPAVDWLNLVLAESQQRRNRRLLAEAIAELCRGNPERLAPYLSDPRWFVVRNAVHILGWIGGREIVGLLQVALRHAEPRVRQEVAAALGQVEPKLARPLLVRMLDGADTRMFCSVLHQLSAERDPGVARLLLGYLQDPGFEQRASEEKHAIYSALSATGGDEVVPELDAELMKGNWFSRNQEAHRQAVARCVARIGTPLAKEVLERGAQSRRGPVRKACEDALQGFNDRG